jgi:hypothetical protein
MYSDSKPCEVCGSEVRLTPHRKDTYEEADDTIDERVCTNDDCPTRTGPGTP